MVDLYLQLNSFNINPDDFYLQVNGLSGKNVLRPPTVKDSTKSTFLTLFGPPSPIANQKNCLPKQKVIHCIKNVIFYFKMGIFPVLDFCPPPSLHFCTPLPFSSRSAVP